MTNDKTPTDGVTMKDGSLAWLTASGDYYCRQEPYPGRKRIVYYSLEKEHIPLAKATCEKCKEVIESKSCGDYVTCGCGAASVDTDRWMPDRHRFIGRAVLPDAQAAESAGENKKCEMPTIIEALTFRMDQYGHKQIKAAKIMGIPRSHLSEILSGKRQPSKGQLKKLYIYGIPPKVLLQ